MTTTGERIKRKRLESGLTAEQLAARAGLALATVSRLERGVGQPHLRTLNALARALDVDPGDLLEVAS